MNVTERQSIAEADDPRLMFTELWTRKEAYVKLLGTGLDMDTLPMLLNEADAYTFRTGYGSGYAYSVVCEADQGEK
jgi:phosphopantetheinyl transferase